MNKLNKVLLNEVMLSPDDWDLYRITADQFEENGQPDEASALRYLADQKISLHDHLMKSLGKLKIRQIAPITVTLSDGKSSTTFTF